VLNRVELKIKQSTSGRGLRPVDGWMMYIDLDSENHSQRLTTFSTTVDIPIIHIYSMVLLNFSFFSWDCSNRSDPWVIPIHVLKCVYISRHCFDRAVRLQYYCNLCHRQQVDFRAY